MHCIVTYNAGSHNYPSTFLTYLYLSRLTCEGDDPDGAADGHPEDPVGDGGVRVVPSPPQKLDACNIVVPNYFIFQNAKT